MPHRASAAPAAEPGPRHSDYICMRDVRAPEYKEADRRTAREADTTARSVVPTERARQAVTDHNVRYVLAFSIAAIVIVFLVVYLLYFG